MKGKKKGKRRIQKNEKISLQDHGYGTDSGDEANQNDYDKHLLI